MSSRIQRNSTALRTVPHPKLIGAGRLVLAKTKRAVFYCQMRQPELENPLFLPMKFPVRRNEFPVLVENRESCATQWDCNANRQTKRTERTETVGSVENSLLFSLLSGNLVARIPPRLRGGWREAPGGDFLHGTTDAAPPGSALRAEPPSPKTGRDSNVTPARRTLRAYRRSNPSAPGTKRR
jgi:hypothetical protein